MPTSWRRSLPIAGVAVAIAITGLIVTLPHGKPRAGIQATASAASPGTPLATPRAPVAAGPTATRAWSTAIPEGPTATSAHSTPTPPVAPTFGPADFVAPAVAWPLPNLDPGLAARGPRPSIGSLGTYLSGNRPIVSVAPAERAAGWQLTRPNMGAVSGYADAVSVIPGGSIGFHLAGSDRTARLDVYRIGRRDGELMLSVDNVPVAAMAVPSPDPATGLNAMQWPVAYRLEVPGAWRSGVYLAKVSGAHGQSYVPFIVRPPRPVGLIVVIPMMTYEAYNSWNGVSLYHLEPHRATQPPRGYKVSFDRPFAWENGAGLLFRTAFPLIVWLEDRGYAPGFIADTDLAANPTFATEARTVVLAGHAEYWTMSMRSALLAAEAQRVGVAAFGGNLAYRQVRLEPGAAGATARTIVSYKDIGLDPLARTDPQMATIEFDKLAVPKPAREVFGADWAGVSLGARPLVVAKGMELFAPGIGLRTGQTIEALLGGEVDQLTDRTRGLALTETPIVNTSGRSISPTASLWVSPGGARVFDAGTFAWTWGLDPRYAAALPTFPADAFARLTASILAWAGTPPGN